MDEKTRQAIAAIETGRLIECTPDEWRSSIRSAVQEQAGRWIDNGDSVRAMIALREVQRLDEQFDYEID